MTPPKTLLFGSCFFPRPRSQVLTLVRVEDNNNANTGRLHVVERHNKQLAEQLREAKARHAQKASNVKQKQRRNREEKERKAGKVRLRERATKLNDEIVITGIGQKLIEMSNHIVNELDHSGMG